jgi:bifunctional UDP-N-acetylglucosamine pyrophosphorylase/glucosamine-1-phosphate N-acetyltransferase
MARKLGAIILAAGKGTRMRSKRPKVLHPVCGRPILDYVLAAVRGLDPAQVIVVVSDPAVREAFSAAGVTFVDQAEPRGTGHALLQARGKATPPTLLVLPGDVPLITSSVLSEFLEQHEKERADLTVLSVVLPAPGSYGRIVRDQDGHPTRIVEARDATADELGITEVNTGIYALRNDPFLWESLAGLGTGNAQREYYLTDLVSCYATAGRRVAAVPTPEPAAVMGVNSRAELARAEGMMRDRIAAELMESGVRIVDPAHTYLEPGVKVGMDTVIHPGTHLRGGTSIGEDCEIGPDAWIDGSTVEAGSRVRYSVLEGARVREGCDIGPYAHLRPGADVGPNVRIGNFVEVKAARVRRGTKAGHLTYIGDAEIGEEVNIGAGTITCNYDGKRKHRTVIGDRAFIGSNTALVAPVEIGEDAIIGAGSTITADVPPRTLGLGRARQVIKERKD